MRDMKLGAAACLRHIAIDAKMGRVLATDGRILDALGYV